MIVAVVLCMLGVAIVNSTFRTYYYTNRVTAKSYAVAFTAVATDGSPLTDGPIVFGNVLANVGNAYDRSTGKFTAPVSGLYSVSVSIMGHYTNHIYVYIRKNGAELVRLYTAGGGRHEISSQTINIPLTRGDQIWASGTSGLKLYAAEPYNVFSVALITEGTF